MLLTQNQPENITFEIKILLHLICDRTLQNKQIFFIKIGNSFVIFPEKQ